MKLQELLAAELARREAYRRAVLEAFEVTGSTADRVRCAEVAGEVARRLGVRVLDNWIQQQVKAAALALGAEMVRPRNKRFYRKLRRRMP